MFSEAKMMKYVLICEQYVKWVFASFFLMGDVQLYTTPHRTLNKQLVCISNFPLCLVSSFYMDMIDYCLLQTKYSGVGAAIEYAVLHLKVIKYSYPLFFYLQTLLLAVLLLLNIHSHSF